MDEIVRKILASIVHDRFLLSKAIGEGLSKEILEGTEEKILVDYIIRSYKQSAEVDVGLLRENLEEDGFLTPKMDEMLRQIYGELPVNLETLLSYIEILKRRFAEKELLSIANKIHSYIETKTHKENVVEFSGDLIQDLRSVIVGRTRRKIDPVRTHLIKFTAELEAREEVNPILGYSIEPFTLLNESLSGARRGFYYALGGAPRRGKTNLMLKVASNVASNEHIPVLYYSWEQTTRVLFLRILAQETLIPPIVLETEKIFEVPNLTERFNYGYARLESYMNYLYLIEGRREDTINRIRSHALSIMEENQTDKIIIVIDYLQKVPTSILYQDLSQQVDEVSGAIASLSLELNCPIFAISSFDKEGSKLDSEDSPQRPTMFNCTGGGDIEYDADVAMVIVKDFKDTNALYEKIANAAKEGRIDPNRIPHFDIINLHIDKNRDAPLGGNIVVQYLFMIEDNNLVEIGFKDIAQDKTYLKVSRLFDWMLENGYLINMR